MDTTLGSRTMVTPMIVAKAHSQPLFLRQLLYITTKQGKCNEMEEGDMGSVAGGVKGKEEGEGRGQHLYLFSIHGDLTEVEIDTDSRLRVSDKGALAETPNEARLADTVVSDEDDFEDVIVGGTRAKVSHLLDSSGWLKDRRENQ